MLHRKVSCKERAFTLLELLIVIVIISTLATIVVPAANHGGDQAAIAAAQSTAQRIQNALDRYRIDHGRYPGPVGNSLSPSWGDSCPSSAAELFPRSDRDRLDFRLSRYSNDAGDVCNQRAEAGVSYPHGPYIRSGIPQNPVTKSDAVLLRTGRAASVSASRGWVYNHQTGEFTANIH